MRLSAAISTVGNATGPPAHHRYERPVSTHSGGRRRLGPPRSLWQHGSLFAGARHCSPTLVRALARPPDIRALLLRVDTAWSGLCPIVHSRGRGAALTCPWTLSSPRIACHQEHASWLSSVDGYSIPEQVPWLACSSPLPFRLKHLAPCQPHRSTQTTAVARKNKPPN